MASFSRACRVSARLARRALANDAAVRGLRTSSAARAAQNFTMPALSPTMTEGNIASWRVKEGEKFTAGDVLLEIETDKATMDVEAQEDGIMMKIMQGDGSKGIQVGTRIAVLAEEGDDISALEIPADEGGKQSPKQDNKPSTPEQAQMIDENNNTETKSEEPVKISRQEATKERAKAAKQTRPLLPSVQHLIKEHGLPDSAVDEMTPTGPNNRLLKGDVLAYLGKIDAKTPQQISERWDHNSHLDLTNIKISIAEPKGAKVPEKTAKTQAPAPTPVTSLSLPISLQAALDIQKKVNATLGTFLPLSTFIARATELANDELPLPANYQPSADELFNQVLGLDKVGTKVSRGKYLPQVSAFPPVPRAAQSKKADIIDILAGTAKKSASVRQNGAQASGVPSGINLFSLTVPKPEEKRAKVFLERVKLVLENDPGRLVL